MRPVLKPGLSRVWLNEHTLQLGRGERQRLYRLERPLRTLLEACDGTRDVPALTEYGERLGVTRQRVLDLLDRLALDGALDDAALSTPDLARMSIAERARLAPWTSALGLRNRLPGGGARALERRMHRQVAVHGLGPVGAQVARQLAASGVGLVRPVDPAAVRHEDTGPGTVGAAEVGRRRQDAVARAVQRLTPSVRVTPTSRYRAPDLAVLAPTGRYPVDLLAELTASGVPHVLVRLDEDEMLVGPLVVPGRTPCVNCLDLVRSEADPGWPLVLAQLGARRPEEHAPQDPAIALLAAAYTAVYALAFLDGGLPPVIGGVIGLRPPYGTARRLLLEPHPDCVCGAADAPPYGNDWSPFDVPRGS